MTRSFATPPRRAQAAKAQAADAAAGDRAYRLFCEPERSPHRSPQYKTLAARARRHLEPARWFKVHAPLGPLQAYEFLPADDTEPRRNVLLVHGWTSEAGFMSAFIEPLRRQGSRVLLFDMPAHGRSNGPPEVRRASMIDCAHATLAVAQACGPFDAVVAHSIGSLASLLAAEGAPPLGGAAEFGRYVLIASPNKFSEVTRDFGADHGLSPGAQRVFERRVERVGHRRLSSFEAGPMLASLEKPALIVHSRDDAQVGFHCAEEIIASAPQATLSAFDELGHATVLFAPPVVRLTRDFIMSD